MKTFIYLVLLIFLVTMINVYVMHVAFVDPASYTTEYEFTDTDFVRTDINLRVHKFDDVDELYIAISPYLGFDDYHRRHGFSMWSIDSNHCDIFVTKPVSDIDLNTWGHELAHCVYGNWHKSYDENRLK